MRSRLPALVAFVLLAIGSVAAPARAEESPLPTSLPVAGTELDQGGGKAVPAPRVAPPRTRRVDGRVGDWVGRISRLAGTAVYSGGEYVYQDHLFDAYGADNGEDVELNSTLEPLADVAPDAYRIEHVFRYLAGELDAPPPLQAAQNYGDLRWDDQSPLFTADLEEVRLAADATGLWLLARTVNLLEADQTAVVLLVDSATGDAAREVGFNTGLTSTKAETAVLMAGSRGWVRDLRTGRTRALPGGTVATNPEGFTNAIEARLPWRALNVSPRASSVSAALATGPFDRKARAFAGVGLPSNVANVAFRFDEPVREWMERLQAFALFERTVDPFFAKVDLAKLRSGASERYAPGPGYHERVFVSSKRIAKEESREGLWQHYGLYLPKTFTERTRRPLQLWLHWRGGTAHSAGAATPRIFRDLGDAHDTIVVSPRGRGTSSWYVGPSHADVLEMWADVTRSFRIDADRTYVAGHSMGGFGSFLFSVLYPDRFAAGLPASPPGTQGAWTGLDFPGCDDMQFEDGDDVYTPCYIGANEGRPRDQAYLRMLGNLRNTPLAIFTGVADELVPYSGVARHHAELMQLGYRHRLYTFLTQEHYGPPVWDQWQHGAEYLHSFVRDPNPAHVTYRRDMRFERAVEEVRAGDLKLSFDFDRAYWMSGLTPADPKAGAATFDGVSQAIAAAPYVALPEAFGPAAPGQTGPFVMSGLRWVADPTAGEPPALNAFQVSLTGASSVTLDLRRMRIDPGSPIMATVTTDGPLVLRLAAPWAAVPRLHGAPLSSSARNGVLSIRVPAGTTTFQIGD